MRKIHLILFVLLGFLLLPTVNFACGNNSGKDSCKNNSSAKTEKMDCCKNDSVSKNKKHDGCNGKCGHSNCVATSFQFTLTLLEIHFKNNNFAFSEEKQNYFNSNNNPSSGFNSLWLIPKIS